MPRIRLPIALALLGAGSLLAPAAATPSRELPQARLVEVQVLGFNDFHGSIEPPTGSSGRIGTIPAGGVEFMATHIAQLEATNPNTVVTSAGDLIGASPLLSALFHDEPTIEAMNDLGLDIAGVGNHEFDEGATELLRMQSGGCHPLDGCQDGDGFDGADFAFTSANVVVESTGQTLFPPYVIKNFKGAKVAFIGETLEGTPTIVAPSGVAGLHFQDEADAVNALIPELHEQGVETIVVLLHEGGLPVPSAPLNGCSGLSGPINDIVERMDDEVDVVISGHTHRAYNCVIDGKVVTSAESFGRLVTDIDIVIDRATRDPVSIQANNLIVTRDVAKDGDQTALIAKYQAVAAPLANRVIGETAAAITRATNFAGESSLGDVVADSQLDATDDPGFGDAVVAFMNPGGIRTDLDGGPVTYGEAFSVQPFGNSLVTMTLSGAQIDTLLEQQWCGQSSQRILQVSAGFAYAWDATAPVCNRVDASAISINGVPVDPSGSYRVTVNSFLADGGDNFTVLRAGTNRLGGAVDVDAFEAYLVTHSPVPPGPMDRIARIG